MSKKKKLKLAKKIRNKQVSKSKKSWLDKRVERQAKRQKLPNAEFKRLQRSKNASRVFTTTLVSQALTPLIEWISISADDNEKIELAKIQRDIVNIQNNKDLAITKQKLEALRNQILLNKAKSGIEPSSTKINNNNNIINSGFSGSDNNSSSDITMSLKGKVNRL